MVDTQGECYAIPWKLDRAYHLGLHYWHAMMYDLDVGGKHWGNLQWFSLFLEWYMDCRCYMMHLHANLVYVKPVPMLWFVILLIQVPRQFPFDNLYLSAGGDPQKVPTTEIKQCPIKSTYGEFIS